MIEYDRKILQEMAELLYQEADRILTLSALKYGIGVGIIGAIIGSYMTAPAAIVYGSMYGSPSEGPSHGLLGFVIGAAVGAFIGWLNARLRALLLKVEAQKLLCQAEIEASTKQLKAA